MADNNQGTEPRLVVASSPTPKVRVLAFNRPEKRNALSQDLIEQFLDELSKASADPDVKVIVVTGSEVTFSGANPPPLPSRPHHQQHPLPFPSPCGSIPRWV